MNIDDIDVDTADDDMENVELDLIKIKNNIQNYTTEKLCEMIVCDRYLKINSDLSTICMEELGRRRDTGENFNYEDFIINAQKDLPVIDIILPDLRSMLNQIIKNK